AVRARHRRRARRGGGQARVLERLSGARRVVRGAAALLTLAPPRARSGAGPALDLEHDLAELAPGGKALVRALRVGQRKRLGDGHAQAPGVEQRQHLALEATRAQRLLLERARAQGRAVDARALA